MTNHGGESSLKPLFHKTLAWFSDLLLPAFVLLALASYFLGMQGFSALEPGLYLFSQLQNQTQSFSLNVQDANALSQGSPVRFIGVTVGQVDKVWADADGAHVRVRLKKGAPAIALGATASVISFGLAGNRSLEFEPPPVSDSKAALLAGVTPSTLKDVSSMNRTFSPYEVERPIRIEETLKVQLQVAQILKTGADNMNAGLFQTPVPQLQRYVHRNRLALEHALINQEQFLKEVESRKQEYHAVTDHIVSLVQLFENSAQNVSTGLKVSEALDKDHLQKQMANFREALSTFEQLKLTSPPKPAAELEKSPLEKAVTETDKQEHVE